MARYKVGDRVVVREDLILYGTYSMDDDKNNTNGVTDSMVNFRGRTVTIKSVGRQYTIKEHKWNWVDGMFAGLESEVFGQPIDAPSDIKALFD